MTDKTKPNSKILILTVLFGLGVAVGILWTILRVQGYSGNVWASIDVWIPVVFTVAQLAAFASYLIRYRNSRREKY